MSYIPTAMKPFQYDKKVWEDGEISRTWQFGIVKNRSLLYVSYETPGGIIHTSGGLNILLTFSSNFPFAVDIQQSKFSFAFCFLCEYFEGWGESVGSNSFPPSP